MSIAALGYIGIGVSDLAAWRAFAGDILGCQIVEGTDGAFFLRVDQRTWRIAIEADARDDILYAGWEVAGPVAFEAVIVRLENYGCNVKRDRGRLAKQRGVMAVAQFTDPIGVSCELFWGAREASLPFMSPVGTSGFVTGNEGLGHIVLGTTDPEAVATFYREVLGFKLSDTIFVTAGPSGFRVPVTFLRCNSRHHSLAYMPNPNPRKLHHFMLQTAALDDVGHALDRLDKSGGKLALTLGRHVNDHMLSFYAYTPSGFEIEYGWGARSIDDATWLPVQHDRISYWGHKFVGKGTPPA